MSYDQVLTTAVRGDVEILDELESQGWAGPNTAAMDGHISTLEWYEKRGILPNWAGANLASKTGQLESLKWMEVRGILPDSAAPAVYGGNLEVVEWLYQHGVLPKRCQEACFKNDLPMMKWLGEKGILPTDKELGICCRKGHLEILKWALEEGITPHYKGANQALLNDQMEVFDWLLNVGIKPGGYIVLECLSNLDKLKKLESIGMVPNELDMKYYGKYASPEVLAWAKEKGYSKEQKLE